MNRRIALSGLSIVGAMTLVGGSAFAAFSSQNANNANTFGGGSIDLHINGSSLTSTPVFTIPGAVPGVPHSADLELTNFGDIPASTVQVANINIGGANPGLAGDVTLVLFTDTNDNGVLDGGETVLGTAHLNDGVWTGYTIPGVSIPADSGGTIYHLGAQVTLDSGAPNSDQGKNMTFDLVFQANQ